MVRLLHIIVVVFFLLLATLTGVAQQQKKNWGKLSGSLESTLGFYVNDSKLQQVDRTDDFGTNTFVNLGYEIGRFRFGVQYDIFEPPLLGTSPELKGNKLMQGFASYADSHVEVRLGTVFEQFGSGLLFRAFEDRALAINNSLMGGKVAWRPWDWVSLKVVAGMPKKFLKYADAAVYGADVELGINRLLFPESNVVLLLGGAWLMRDDHSELEYKLAPQTVRGYAGRMHVSKGAFSFGGEYTAKSRALVIDKSGNYFAGKGKGLLLNMGLDFVGIGCSIEYRSLKFMDNFMDDAEDGMQMLTLNYVPSLTRQHKYALLMLFPHEAKAVGETGGQFDIYGDLSLGKRNDLSWSLNGSMFRKLVQKDSWEDYYFLKMGALQYAEVGLELEKKLGRKVKVALATAWQKKSEFSRLGFGDMMMNTEVLVADVLYKFTSKTSLRMELQHAWSDSKDDQAWAYGLLELGLAPRWMFYVSDMCNYKSASDTIHYFSVGGSFSWKMLRASAAYGRNRGGTQCSGGVCRYVPEHCGVSVGISMIF